ncbi:MAG: hypothetical protein RJA70_500 [Pseudomonadota bacterium]|jgi:arylsulfatase A-like enzyme
MANPLSQMLYGSARYGLVAALVLSLAGCGTQDAAPGPGKSPAPAATGTGGFSSVDVGAGGAGGSVPTEMNKGGAAGSSEKPAEGGSPSGGSGGAKPPVVPAAKCEAQAQLKARLLDSAGQALLGCEVGLVGGNPAISANGEVALAQQTDSDVLEVFCKGFVAERVKAASCGQDLGDLTLIDSPNILFAIADDASQDSFDPSSQASRYVDTPAFDKLAAEGMWFANAYDSNPKCAPARATLLSGRHFWQNREAANHFSNFPAALPRYTQVLVDNGWVAAQTGKGWGPGKNLGFGTGDDYSDLKLNAKTASGINATDYSGNFKAFLSKTPKPQRWTFWYGATEPHRVYEAGSGVKNGKQLANVHVPLYYPDEPLIRSDLADYAVEVEWYDKHLGEIVEHLRSTGELDNTIVLATSDHGMPFPRVKGNLYEQGHHVPLVVRWPKLIKPGRKVIDFVNFPDFAPTYLELAGIRPPKEMTGRSFLDVLRSEASGQVDPSRDFVVTGKEFHDPCGTDPDDPTEVDANYPVRAIRKGDLLYLHNLKPKRWPASDPPKYANVDDSPTLQRVIALAGDTVLGKYYDLSLGKRVEEELYNVKLDPDCVNNLADNADGQEAKTQLRAQMEAFLKEHGDPRTLGDGEVFEEYVHFITLSCNN